MNRVDWKRISSPPKKADFSFKSQLNIPVYFGLAEFFGEFFVFREGQRWKDKSYLLMKLQRC